MCTCACVCVKQYTPGFNVNGRECDTTSCPELGLNGTGRYYTKSERAECQTALCTTARKHIRKVLGQQHRMSRHEGAIGIGATG